MFNNIGKKIKALAALVTLGGIIASVVGGVSLMLSDSDYIVLGVAIIIAGSFVSWLGSIMVYGYGQLIDNTDKLVSINKKLLSAPVLSSDAEKEKRVAQLTKWKNDGLITEEEFRDLLYEMSH